jgi:MFS family permease
MVDRFGARDVFTAAIAVFTGTSVLCGLSTGQWGFTACRVLQGVGGSMMMPVGRLVLLRILLPLMFQLGFGLDAFVSGLLTLAVFAGS